MRRFILLPVLLLFAVILGAQAAMAAQLTLVLPLNRTAYQTNEQIDLSVVRQDAQALPAGTLTLTVTGEDASKLTFDFPVQAVAMAEKDARTTEHLHLNGWLLRPGHYTVQVDCDGATAQKPIQLFTHIRKSTYRTLHWWGPGGNKMPPEGENGFGYNTIYGGVDEPSIRGGEDIMGLDLMGGGHQFDLKMYNDWSDPNVYIGADQRALDRAFTFRTMPNNIGAHLYDEPGLTYGPSHADFGPWDIPTQRRAYKDAFGKEQLWHDEVKPADPASLAKWTQITNFRLGFMDAFWKSAYNGLSRLKPGYLVATQSQYGWWALYDGYYFNVARSLPVISGHGGYDDYGERNFNPSFYVEMSLPRQTDKPTWYLGDWGVYSNEQIREEHYLAFMAGIQGIAGGPGMVVDSNNKGAEAGVETNKALARLGTIFAKPAYTRQDVALFYSKSDFMHATQAKDALSNKQALGMLYTATRMDQYPITTVLEEDILDGSLAANHKVLLMSDIQYLDPVVIAALESYIHDGGVVMMTDDCTVNIKGAMKIGYTFQISHDIKAISFPDVLNHTQPLADALKAQLQKLGIRPAFGTTAANIAPGRQVRGDIEYIFACNFTTYECAGLKIVPDEHPEWSPNSKEGNPAPILSTITLPADGRPVYDAMRGGAISFEKKGQDVSATMRFGPGQMRVFARTPRPIGGVQVAAPIITRDYTRATEPLTLDISAALVDTNNKVIAGTTPMEIKVIDPLGDTRYDIFRAAEQGVCQMSLPMAINDPAGAWTVSVKELLNNSIGKANFTYQAIPHCGAAAGKTHRAVYFPLDKENIYQLFRNQRTMTIVTGASDYNAAAAERLATALKPYNVICNIVTAKDANTARPLTDEEAATWCGMYVAGALTPDQRKNPQAVGYNLPGPSILLGNPKDNPLIQHLTMAAGSSVLPYPITADFPGRGHGYIAWNLMALGHDLETVACIANDADGMNEAVGTLFELAIGMDAQTPYALPSTNTVTAATLSTAKPTAPIAWQAVMPDTISGLLLDGNVSTVYSWDGSMANYNNQGKPTLVERTPKKPVFAAPSKDVSKLPKDKLIADLAVKQVLTGGAGIAVAYWGGTLQIFATDGTLKTQQMLPQDITAMLWNGDTLVTGLAGGDVIALKAK